MDTLWNSSTLQLWELICYRVYVITCNSHLSLIKVGFYYFDFIICLNKSYCTCFLQVFIKSTSRSVSIQELIRKFTICRLKSVIKLIKYCPSYINLRKRKCSRLISINCLSWGYWVCYQFKVVSSELINRILKIVTCW